MNFEMHFSLRLLQISEELSVITFVHKYGRAPVTSAQHMINSSGIPYSFSSRHIPIGQKNLTNKFFMLQNSYQLFFYSYFNYISRKPQLIPGNPQQTKHITATKYIQYQFYAIVFPKGAWHKTIATGKFFLSKMDSWYVKIEYEYG